MIIRAEHDDAYVCLSNALVRNSRLSLEARGFLAYLLSMSDDWSFSIKGLAAQLGVPERTVMRLVKQLKTEGYVVQKTQRDERGHFVSCVWDVSECPNLNTLTEVRISRSAVEPQCGLAVVRSDGSAGSRECGLGAPIRNTNNKEIPNKRSTKDKKYTPGRGEFLNVYVSEIEFEKLTERFGVAERDSRIEDLSRYLANHPKKKYASHYATILAWARKDQKDSKASSTPTTAGGIDWDRVAMMAAEQFNGGQNT